MSTWSAWLYVQAELATARSQLHAAEERQRMEQKQEAELQQELLIKVRLSVFFLPC